VLFREADSAALLPRAEVSDASVEAAHVTEPTPPRRSNRLLNLDLMRGYFVLILAAVHLNYVPSLFGWFDGRGVLWASEADGFFFISGMLVAMLRKRDLAKGGLVLATQRSWRRARQLYVVACGLTLFYTALGRFMADQDVHGVKGGLDAHSSWLEVVWRTLTLRYVYGWADFLTFYVPMFIVAPVLVWALTKRWDWLVVVLSLGAYVALTWWYPGPAQPFLQWQAPFVLGAVVGFHFDELRAWFAGMRRAARLTLAVAAMVAAAAIYAAGLLMLFHPSWHPPTSGVDTPGLYNTLLGNNRLGLLRPLLCLVMFAGGYVALSYLQRPVMATIGRLLELFGQNSLYVYVVQSFFVFMVPFVLKPHGFFVNTALDLAIVALVWLGLKTNFLTKYIPR